MPIFAVTAIDKPDALRAAIVAKFPNDFIQITPNQWLVALKGVTTKELSDKLGITEGKTSGLAIVMSVTGHFGLAATSIWEWIKVKSEAVSGG